MAVPLEDYTVREKGIVSYDTLKSVAKEYGTTAQALKYFNGYSPYYDEIKKLNTGEGLFNFASKIDPAKIPKLKVPKIPTGGNTTNTTAGSVSSSSYNSIISKRIILKRINASYGTALKNNIPFLGENKQDVGEYIFSDDVKKYYEWKPLYGLMKNFQENMEEHQRIVDDLNRRGVTPTQDLQDQLQNSLQENNSKIFGLHRSYYAKILSLYETKQDRIIKFDIKDLNNPTQTPADTEADKEKVLAIIEKIVDLTSHEDSYGHWWLEIYEADIDLPLISGNKSASFYESVAPKKLKASYGFWPLQGAGLFKGAVTGSVPGGINRCNNFDISNPDDQFDPYAGKDTISWKVDSAYFVTDPYGRSENEIYDDIVEYLTNYPDNRRWAWPDTGEDQEHCQTFQKELLAACMLIAAPRIEEDQYPPMDKHKIFYGNESLTGDTQPDVVITTPPLFP